MNKHRIIRVDQVIFESWITQIFINSKSSAVKRISNTKDRYMLEFNGNNYVRPYSGAYPHTNDNQRRMQLSTASISSHHSASNHSTSKYSFKTGGLKNIYTTKFDREHPLNFRSPKRTDHYDNTRKVQQQNRQASNYVQNNYKSSQRSKSLDSSYHYYKPIPDPTRVIYTKNTEGKYFPQYAKYEQNLMNQKKLLLEQSNLALKKSISQKKIRFQKRFSQLNSQVNSLKNQFSRQQQKMDRITAIVNQYFR